MDRDKRIEELEAELRDLKALVQRMGEGMAPADASVAPTEVSTEDVEGARGIHFPGVDSELVRDVRDRAESFFRGDSEESIETRIGSVWLSRLAVLVTMTAVALGARITFTAEAIGGYPIGPFEKTVIGFTMAFVFMGYGLFTRWRLGTRREYEAPGLDLFAQAILGCGLAGLYFTTYATFFVAEMQMVANWLPSLLPLLGALVIVGVVAHRQRSATVAGISLFLAYYTVALSAVQEPSTVGLAYALMTCAAVAVTTLVLHVLHRWFVFSWLAIAAAYLTYAWFFLWRDPSHLSGGLALWLIRPPLPSERGFDETTWFWWSLAFLLLCYLVFAITCIVDARKAKDFRHRVASMATVNSVVFYGLTWMAVRDTFPENVWPFRALFTALLLVLAVLAGGAGPRWNFLVQVFVAKAVVVFTLMLQAGLPREWLLVTFAAESLVLAVCYRYTGAVLFKVLGTVLALVTFALGLISFRMPGEISLFDMTLPANWFNTCGAAGIFVLCSWFYDKFGRLPHAHDPDERSGWLFGDGWLDFSRATLSMVYASGAAILLLTVTIMELGDSPRMPFMLAAQGIALAVAGLILFTAPVEAASVLLIAAAHVCYHIFLWMPLPGFEQQTWFPAFTLTLALFTYIVALGWERYLKRFHFPSGGMADLEHHFVASVPYLAATVIAGLLLRRQLDPLHVPAAVGGMGLALLLLGSLTRYPGVRASGVLASGLAAFCYYEGLYSETQPIASQPLFPVYAVLFLASLVGMERLYVVLKRQGAGPSNSEDLLRTALALAAIGLGVLGLYVWSPGHVLSLALLVFSVLVILLGVVFREPRYRFGALVLLAGTVFIAFLQFQERSEAINLLTFGAAAGVLLIVSWAYSRGFRQRRLPLARSQKKDHGQG